MPASLKYFARTFESTFKQKDKTLFKIATGIDREHVNAQGQNANSNNKKVWITRFGDGGIKYAINKQQQPFFFAPRPLATSLISLEAPIFNYTSGKGLDLIDPIHKSFSGIDLDKWGQQCLQAIDELLSPEFAVPAAIVSNGGGATGATGSGPTGARMLDSILQAKKNLASALSQDIENIVAPAGPTGATGPTGSRGPSGASLSDAQEKLKQRLLIKLSDVQDVDAIVQHPVQVAGPTGATAAPQNFLVSPW